MSYLQKRTEQFKIAGILKTAGLYPYFRMIESGQDTEVLIDGKNVLMFGSNNYMGLTSHAEVKNAAMNAIAKYGTGCSGSRFLNGTSKLHVELEKRIAEFLNKEEAIVFSTGYQTNLGVIATLSGRHDFILIDELSHASIIEGSRLSFSKVIKFRHNDMQSLEKELKTLPEECIKLIVTDGVFSMEGDIANLPEIVDLADKYKASVIVDDAHAIGVLGKNGEGTAAYFGITERTEIIVGTFSKSLASLGGYVAATSSVINYLKHHARPMIFSASIPPSSAAAALAALDIIIREPQRIERLWENTTYMRHSLCELGFDVGKTQTPIIPVYIRDDYKTFEYTVNLLKEGLFVNPVVSPAVPKNASLIRISLMATHTREQINKAIEILYRVSNKLGVAIKEKHFELKL